ncbi:DUF6544 family protein [Flavilitoribacter nigricans]|uniref:Uncharacterized protein n=1 Tax=Flavilitoribacter nigricans (strain ATCC 23147 / DSM 23189 / NBRC 102662 / NCIMB 1420 / SS-2) TaxID=1122177 RepID=A0A2D0NIK0_FLAN2|nr:DUF6544 family protein [Flavilitoribacter nigricans]PHN08277.1 hypothetical protein CRP01_02850 [Flavilitoribacter nigricans DSM 23189 = NBRC 102662]
MLRILFASFIAIHGLIHLLGFLKAFDLAAITQLNQDISRARGIGWLLASILIVGGALLFALQQPWWWIPGMLGAFLSQVLIFMAWSDARAGTLPNVLLILVAVLGFGAWEFRQSVKGRVVDIWPEESVQTEKVLAEELLTLPEPVQKWLQRTGVPDRDRAKKIYLQQKGQMRTAPGGKWMDFEAEQWFLTEQPTFLWHAKVGAGSPVRLNGRDQLIGGHGRMLIKLFGLIPIVDADGPTIDQGTLLRYLAETIWFPSAATEPYIQWTPIDSLRARATLTIGQNQVSGVFFFNEAGDVVGFEALRYYDRKGTSKLEVWHIAIDGDSYRNFNGLRIPVKSQVSWNLEEGEFLWLKLEITDHLVNASPDL